MRIKRIQAQMQNPQKLRVCAYARVSTDSLEQEGSLENQTEFFTNYIQTHADWELTRIYSDQGISGYREDREGFQLMMVDARLHAFDLIVVKSVSRFARNTETTLKATRELKRLGIGVYFFLQDANTLNTSGELMLTIRAAFAQAESEVGSDNLKMVYRRKFAKGIPSGKTPFTFGFRPGDNGEMTVDEDKAEIVRFIYNLAEQGVWVSKIANRLNDMRIPAIAGGKWNQKGVDRILRNVLYKGDLHLQKKFSDSRHNAKLNHGEVDQWYIRENHPPIVTPAQWDNVQTVLADRGASLKTPLPSQPALPRSTHARYPLSGLMHCPYCGATLQHFWGNQRREYWVCRTNVKVSAAACKGIYVPAAATESWNLREPVVVIKYQDQNGMDHFTAFPQDEYDQLKEEQNDASD